MFRLTYLDAVRIQSIAKNLYDAYACPYALHFRDAAESQSGDGTVERKHPRYLIDIKCGH